MKNIVKIILPILLISFLFSACQTTQNKYDCAVKCMDQADWDSAIEYLTDLNYENSKELLNECNMHKCADYDFLNDMSISLMKRYEKAEKTNDLGNCIEIEIVSIQKYKELEFFDKELQRIALSYIEGVEIEKESLTENDGEKQLKKEEGYVKRLNALKELTDEYNFLSDNIEYRAAYYNKVDEANKNYKALKAIEEDIGKQLKDGLVADYVDEYTARIRLKNNTKYAYDLTVYFTFYNKKGTIVETTTEYYDNVKAGKSVNLDFYFPEGAETFDWYTEELIRWL